MARLAAFRDNVKSALNIPRDGFKPRSRRQVISFNEALENLKASQTGSVTCGAFNSFGRCRKQISLDDPKLLASLGRFDKSDIQTPVKLMPLMLCPSHWSKTVYYNALFLDWVTTYGSKRDDIHFENIVVDYQSAVVIESDKSTRLEVPTFSGAVVENRGRSISAPSIHINKEDHDLTATNALLEGQIDIDLDESSPLEPSTVVFESDHTTQMPPDTSLVVTMDSFTSIELGVVSLEILYQEHLKCVAMTSNGWRCPKNIDREKLLQARQLLNSTATSGTELNTELLPRLVLCPGHAGGNLPHLYSVKWAAFSEQRLPKDEALSKFNADFWMSVEFFPNEGTQPITFRPKSPNRPRSASALPAHHRQKSDSKIGAGDLSNLVRPHTGSRHESNTQTFEFRPPSSPIFTIVKPLNEKIAAGAPSPHESGETIEKSLPLQHNAGAKVSQPVQSASECSPHRIVQHISQAMIDKSIISEISLPVPSKGYVHIFKSPTGDLYRLGTRASRPHPQQTQVERQTQNCDDIKVKSIRTEYPERVIKLVLLELQNFRAELSSDSYHQPQADGDELGREHREWLKVPENVVTLSVYTWSNVVSNAYEPGGGIKEAWAKRLTLLPQAGLQETELLGKALKDADGLNRCVNSYHDERYKRYRGWISEGLPVYS